MATSPYLFTLSFVLFLASTSLTSAAFSPSSVASAQLKFWSKNMHGGMPEALFSKLSPLSMHDSSYFVSLITKKSFSSNADFCSLANLACSTKYHNLKMSSQSYNMYAATAPKSLSSEHFDANSFFRISVLQKGNKVQLPNLDDKFPRRSFLPSEIASSISLSSTELQKLFPESFSSSNTKDAIQTSLMYCNAPSLEGEIKSCPKSLEDMLEFSQKVLGQKQIAVMTSKNAAKGSRKELSIGNIKQSDAQKIVSCHEVFFPFATYFCHLLSSTHLYSVDLIEPETRAPVTTILAACHMDTSTWPQEHVAFKILKSSPGQAEACHWLTQVDLVWVGEEGRV